MSEPVTAEQAPRVDWRYFLTMLAIFSVAFFVQPGPASAQTYVYIGPNWNLAQCAATGATACINGSVTGSVTLNGVSPSYTGAVPQSKVSSYQINATGNQSINDLSALSWSNATMANGQFTSWRF